jgi:hypothetical protein
MFRGTGEIFSILLHGTKIMGILFRFVHTARESHLVDRHHHKSAVFSHVPVSLERVSQQEETDKMIVLLFSSYRFNQSCDLRLPLPILFAYEMRNQRCGLRLFVQKLPSTTYAE